MSCLFMGNGSAANISGFTAALTGRLDVVPDSRDTSVEYAKTSILAEFREHFTLEYYPKTSFLVQVEAAKALEQFAGPKLTAYRERINSILETDEKLKELKELASILHRLTAYRERISSILQADERLKERNREQRELLSQLRSSAADTDGSSDQAMLTEPPRYR